MIENTDSEQLERANDRIVELLRKKQPWQPIDTAPKDGTSFVATMAGGNDGPYYVLFWNDIFFESAESGEGPNMDHLTHWMPLPVPPKVQP